jgi:AcrR family transcriptional regulator
MSTLCPTAESVEGDKFPRWRWLYGQREFIFTTLTSICVDVNVMNMNARRAYDMTGRTAAAAQTAERITSTAMGLLKTEPVADITLNDIAAGAGVTVQTVLRRFGDRDSVFAAAIEGFALEVFAQRGRASSDDLDDAVTNLVDHYEQWGALVIKMISEQAASPALRATVEGGAEFHRDWCSRVFADSLAGLPRPDRMRRTAQLTAICDVRTWDLLRRQGRLSRAQTHQALVELLEPLTISTN